MTPTTIEQQVPAPTHAQQALSAFGNVYQFTGRRFDDRAGLYYNRYRYYEPCSGRFISRDPLGHVEEMNLYVGMVNNPASRIDALGLQSSGTAHLAKALGKLKKKLREKRKEALGKADSEEAKKVKDIADEALDKLEGLVKGGGRAAAIAGLIFEYARFQIDVAITVIDAWYKFAKKEDICRRCLQDKDGVKKLGRGVSTWKQTRKYIMWGTEYRLAVTCICDKYRAYFGKANRLHARVKQVKPKPKSAKEKSVRFIACDKKFDSACC